MCQSDFRKGHSTDTPLLPLLSDIYGVVVDRFKLTFWLCWKLVSQ